ncbi:hypothetical protein [Pseudomonas sp. TNT2022 ID642]|uniref:hypothetical protein n=1 Tax=Pseudomonas sp. TNT2022 ID642 TaxID=2942632 RepID=UPI00235E366F|nr:hypothetical protein [Pseudomonas sp. TNT2022 ID642]MDD1002443.1 hypothetical protein [Pseudomonas sp. TNT2022 ID642]
MVVAQPKTKAAELAERVNAMWSKLVETGVLDDFDWHSLRRELEKSEKNPELRSDSYLLRAVVYSFKQDIDSVERMLNLHAGVLGKTWNWYAVRAGIGPSISNLSYVLEMLSFGYPKDNPTDLVRVLEPVTQFGLFSTAKNVVAQFHKIGIADVQPLTSANVAYAIAAANYFEAHGVDEREVALRIKCASEIVRKHFTRLKNFRLTANEWGVSFEYIVDAEIEYLIDVDWEITEALCVMFDDPLSEHVTIGTTPEDKEL